MNHAKVDRIAPTINTGPACVVFGGVSFLHRPHYPRDVLKDVHSYNTLKIIIYLQCAKRYIPYSHRIGTHMS